MSELVAQLTLQGYQEQLKDTRQSFEKCSAQLPSGKEISFPDTNYSLPLYFALTGNKIKSLQDIKSVISGIDASHQNISVDKLDLGGIAGLGLDVLLLQEMRKAMENSMGETVNFIPDVVLRSLGVQLVSGDINGIAVIIGPAKDEQTAVDIIRSLQEKNILTVLAGNCEGRTMVEQLKSQNVEMSLDTYIVHLGNDTESVVLALNWAIRAALTFGGLEGGQKKECLEYCAKRVPAFALALSCIDPKRTATAAGAIAMGFPVICDFEVPEIKIKDEQGFDKFLLTHCSDVSKIVDRAIEIRQIKVKISKIPIPVKFGAAFEGERIRKEDLACELGGKGTLALELVTSKGLDEVQNKKISVTGKEIDQTAEGESLNAAIVVKVAGKNMQKDFEPILERQIHHYINCAMGIMHMGQRNLVRIRIGKKAREQGFKFRHLGEIIYAKLMTDYHMIVDKIEINIITITEQVRKTNIEAEAIYKERDKRIGAMTDESVDVFYSCTLCQSFAPNHVCMITPERLGLCGAYNWLDGKAAYQIMPEGPNQPVKKGAVIDQKLGQWKGINDFVFDHSNKTVERFSAYSLMTDPMTSCGCFECIVAVLPGTGGFMVVDRTYQGQTPCGMTFSTLAGVVGGGKQSPGFLGIGINYIISKKFISAEGGISRLVWMPSQLKERLKDCLMERAGENGHPDLLEKIADETVTTDLSGLIGFLTEKKHPALELGDLI